MPAASPETAPTFEISSPSSPFPFGLASNIFAVGGGKGGRGREGGGCGGIREEGEGKEEDEGWSGRRGEEKSFCLFFFPFPLPSVFPLLFPSKIPTQPPTKKSRSLLFFLHLPGAHKQQ